jgi:hypothetical protein
VRLLLAIVATGQAFIDAKAECDHGNFEKLFANHPKHVPEPVNCNSRTARKLMAIARNAELSNRTHGSVLPSSWRTLYELSRIDPQGLKIAFDEHWITPEMERVRNYGELFC